MNQSKHVKNLSKYEMKLIAKMRGITVKNSTSKVELLRIFKKGGRTTYNESPFKSIIADTRSNLPKRGHKLTKNGLKYVEEMKDLTKLQVKTFKENLFKFKNDLIKKNKINNRIKKDFNNYYQRINFRMLKISDIYLVKKMILHMKILGICLINLHLNQ